MQESKFEETNIKMENEQENRIGPRDIMSWDEYIKREAEAIEKGSENGIEFYGFEVAGRGEYEGKYVSYFGVPHDNNPESETFKEIEDRFGEAKPDIVFVEGYRALNETNDQETEYLRNLEPEEAIRKIGENGFTAKLAAERGVPVESPEPEPKDEVNYLLEQGFSKDHIFAYYFYKMIPTYLLKAGGNEQGDEANMDNFRDFMEPTMENAKQIFREELGWENFDASFDHALDIGRAIWNEELDLKNFDEKKVYPVLREEDEDQRTAINDIAGESSLFRDVHIVNKIGEALKEHNRLFVVYGSSHAVMQEGAVRKMLEREE